MIFVFSWNQQERDLGPAEWRDCAHCGNHGRWRQVEVAHRLTIFFVPVLTMGHTRWTVCPVCRTGYRAPNG
jgi:hypothetical protein